MDRRTTVCIWIIWLGLANFAAYVVLYWVFWGEAINGDVREIDGKRHYYLNPTQPDKMGEEVSKAVFIYSGIHSISIAPTVGAIMLAMLTLAKERVVSSMRATILRGRTLLTVLATLISVFVALWTAWFIIQFLRLLSRPEVVEAASRAVTH